MHTTAVNKSEKGFSLIEMAISLMVIGVLMVPAIHGYSLYLAEQQKEQTNFSLDAAASALSNFKTAYGRYPCPARGNAVRGDADYGREWREEVTPATVPPTYNCSLSASIDVVTSNSPVLAGGLPPNTDADVFIGVLPFRQLNLPHEVVHDGYNNRLTYAVTEALTKDEAFRNDRGGIEIVDTDGNQLIEGNPFSAHFVLISHNADKAGAYTREGTVADACPGVTDPDNENCDRNDAIFVVGPEEADFDDKVFYITADNIKQWQLSNDDQQDIHLVRDKEALAIGAGVTDDPTNFATAEISLNVIDDATVLVEDDSASGDLGLVRTGQICESGGTDCFSPSRISGTNDNNPLTPSGESIYCEDPTQPYLVGIANDTAICTDEVFFNCPPGEFIEGFDSDGNLICNSAPPQSCADQNLPTTCGGTDDVSAFYQAGQWWGYGYSGQCYMIENLDDNDIDTILAGYDPTDPNFYDPGQGFDQAIADIQAHIDGLNNAVRTPQDCGPDGVTALVRDTFMCNNGVWNPTPAHRTEKIERSEDFSGFGPTYTGGSHPAETNGASYNPASPMSVDPDNNDWNRDCWCREDFRLVQTDCAGNAVGQRFRIDRHRCPQTTNHWNRVYPNSGGWSSALCGCSASSSNEQMSCRTHFGYSGNGIDGQVDFIRDTTCSGTTPTTTDHSFDASNCFCPLQPDNRRTVNCPFGYTNNFTYDGTSYTGVAEIYEEAWTCPTGAPGSAPVASVADAGYYEAETLVYDAAASGNACTCDSTLTQNYHEDCPAGFVGAGTDWVLPYNCTTDSFDPPSDANKVAEDCRRCVWVAGTARAGNPQSFAATYEIGQDCPSCTGSGSCFDVVGADQYDVYDGCYCAGQ